MSFRKNKRPIAILALVLIFAMVVGSLASAFL